MFCVGGIWYDLVYGDVIGPICVTTAGDVSSPACCMRPALAPTAEPRITGHYMCKVYGTSWYRVRVDIGYGLVKMLGTSWYWVRLVLLPTRPQAIFSSRCFSTLNYRSYAQYREPRFLPFEKYLVTKFNFFQLHSTCQVIRRLFLPFCRQKILYIV